MFEQAVELISEHIISLLVLAARRGTINTEEDDSLLSHREIYRRVRRKSGRKGRRRLRRCERIK